MSTTASDYTRVLISCMDKPARLPALLEVHEAMTPEVFWPVFHSVWTGTESAFLHNDKISAMITPERMKSHARLKTMSPTELFTFNQFVNRKDGMVRVYRGAAVHGKGVDNIKGWAWSLSKEKAVWFAKRYGTEHPVLIAGRANAGDILFYCDDKNEQEVVVNPARVYIEDAVELPGQPGGPNFTDKIGKNSQVYGSIYGTDPFEDERVRLAMLAKHFVEYKGMTPDAALGSIFEDREKRCRDLGFVTRADELARLRTVLAEDPLLVGAE